MTVEAIKQEISHLSELERREVFAWIEELEERAWDREMERDFAPGGRGEHLLAEIQASGRTKPLAEVLAEARATREQSRS